MKQTTIKAFEFVLPTQIKYGKGIVKTVAGEVKRLGCQKPMVVTDQGLIKAGLVKEVTDSLERENVMYTIFDQIEPNPRDTTVQNAYEQARKDGADMLIAIGGGSSMDTAKAIGVLMTHGGKINDYEGLDKITKPICPLMAILTTVGTGSEVTFWSVITDTTRHFKMSVGSPLIAANITLVDPDMVAHLPAPMVAATGMDTLTHAVEGYTCTLSEPITDACGIYAIRMIGDHIRDAVAGDEEARGRMLLASLIAGICFGNSDIAGVHCMGEALGGLYDTPHGVSMAILLPYVMEYNYKSDYNKFSEIATALGADTTGLTPEQAAPLSVEAVRKLNRDLEIPTLKDVGTKEEDLPELAKRAFGMEREFARWF